MSEPTTPRDRVAIPDIKYSHRVTCSVCEASTTKDFFERHICARIKAKTALTQEQEKSIKANLDDCYMNATPAQPETRSPTEPLQFSDTALKQAIRRAFDDPTIENIESVSTKAQLTAARAQERYCPECKARTTLSSYTDGSFICEKCGYVAQHSPAPNSLDAWYNKGKIVFDCTTGDFIAQAVSESAAQTFVNTHNRKAYDIARRRSANDAAERDAANQAGWECYAAETRGRIAARAADQGEAIDILSRSCANWRAHADKLQGALRSVLADVEPAYDDDLSKWPARTEARAALAAYDASKGGAQ